MLLVLCLSEEPWRQGRQVLSSSLQSCRSCMTTSGYSDSQAKGTQLLTPSFPEEIAAGGEGQSPLCIQGQGSRLQVTREHSSTPLGAAQGLACLQRCSYHPSSWVPLLGFSQNIRTSPVFLPWVWATTLILRPRTTVQLSSPDSGNALWFLLPVQALAPS